MRKFIVTEDQLEKIVGDEIDTNLGMDIVKTNDDEIIVNTGNLKNYFDDIGEGVDNIEGTSHFNKDTKEYTNSVLVTFHRQSYGSLSEDDINNIIDKGENLQQRGIIDDYDLISSRDSIILNFDSTLPMDVIY